MGKSYICVCCNTSFGTTVFVSVFFFYSNSFSSECKTGVDCIPKRHNYH